ncbi:hypothetical protein [Streptomyces sp. NPDC058664]|uniref:hypothetical protein n=1 Tax=unclassified Streptomyces TaxID=2593676 RepID=UPI0036668CCE
MADERYQWLDQEAAERLLRGEPVDAVDDHARAQAGRLAEALEAARTPVVPPARPGELPGEAAALAAFRQAAAGRAAVGASAVTGTRGRTVHADLGRVRLTQTAPPARRWGRSVRYGLAAAVAAVTVGGVAVAAGTGVLPLVGPAPASSVTAGETAAPLVSKEPGIREDPEAPPTDPGTSGEPAPGTTPTAGTAAPPTGGPDGPGTGTRDPGTPQPGRTTAGPGAGTGSGGTGTGSGGTTEAPGTETSLAKAVKACREYRSGRLDATGRKQLTNSLRGGETLRRYCDRILGGATGAPEGGAEGDGTGGSGSGSEDDPKDDSEGDGRNDDRTRDQRDGAPDDERGGSVGDRAGNGGRDHHGTAPLSAELPLGIAVTARVPLAV